MGANTKIQWCDHTWNPWRGCTKVSDGCKHCYAETMSKRNLKVLGQWGPNGTRVVASESMWREPEKWNKAAAAIGERHRVFCASLADVFEANDTMPEASWKAVDAARDRLFALITDTPHLDWLLLTKRPENIQKVYDRLCWPESGCTMEVPPNIWLGTSVENSDVLEERVTHLVKAPAAVRFLSCEPLLGPLNLENHAYVMREVAVPVCDSEGNWLGDDYQHQPQAFIDWVIVGGESGGHARPFNVEWARSIRDQCKAAGLACFIKQLGARPISRKACDYVPDAIEVEPIILKDSHGGDWSEWPEDLRVRDFPKASVANA